MMGGSNDFFPLFGGFLNTLSVRVWAQTPDQMTIEGGKFPEPWALKFVPITSVCTHAKLIRGTQFVPVNDSTFVWSGGASPAI